MQEMNENLAMNTILLLVLSPPRSHLAYHAVKLAQCLKQQQQPFQVFFYQDGCSVADQNLWYADDELNLTAEWQNLEIDLPVCVSAALHRGICDQENAERHTRPNAVALQANLATGFRLVGLGQLANAVAESKHILQF